MRCSPFPPISYSGPAGPGTRVRITGCIGPAHIQTHLRLIDAINAEIARLDEAIGQQLAQVPRTAPCCTACGLAGGGHAPGCAGQGTPR
jgi:hypothetical protein